MGRNCSVRNNHHIFLGLRIRSQIVRNVERFNDSIKIGEVLVYLGHYVESTISTVSNASFFVGISYAIGSMYSVCKFPRKFRGSS